MKNASHCPDQFTWLYGGIDFNLEGNGGPECAIYLSVTHRILETILILFVSIVEIALAVRQINCDEKSSFNPSHLYLSFFSSSNQSKGVDKKLSKPNTSLPQQKSGTKIFLLIVVCIVFGIEIGYKFSTDSLIFLLNPCHILTFNLIFFLAVDETKPSAMVTSVFRVHLHLLSGALLAILLPVVNTRFLSFEKHSYWVHHILIYIVPGYLLTLGGPFTAESLTNVWWPILSIGIGFFYHFTVLQGLAMVTQANLNNMLCPALSDPFEGPYYRLWAFGHQHLLNFVHGKIYLLASYGVVMLIGYCCKVLFSKKKNILSKSKMYPPNIGNGTVSSTKLLSKKNI